MRAHHVAEGQGKEPEDGRVHRARTAPCRRCRAIKQVLVNLLSNAVKFTEDDGVIKLRARKVGDSILISICDDGIGIPRDAMTRLGQPFEQVANQLTKNHQGSGLGLAISRSLVELHGGTLRIRSRENIGTTVSVRIPTDACREESVREAATA